MKASVKLIAGILFGWFSIHTTIIVIDGLTDDNVGSEVGVIFGNKVNPDGSLSERLKARLDKGIEMYRDSLVRILFVSGGLGKEGHYEGTKMHEYLIENGIPKEMHR
jgi:vancomycin permeability regulator SanA